MKKAYSLREIVECARDHSPFYKSLYANLPSTWTLRDLPILDQKSFWEANSAQNNLLLTGPMKNGFVFKSGGTTGKPKFSVYLQSEWEAFTAFFGEGMSQGGLRAGAKVANLFYAGDLYASFLFIMKSMELAPVQVMQLPISGSAPIESTIKNIQEFGVDVVAGVPTTILGLAEELEKQGIVLDSVTSILFGGESMYPDQRESLKKAFPNARIQSIGCASVDGGLLGWVDESCALDEHRVFDGATLVEIVDDDGQPIEEVGQSGRVLLTNLTRKLMPILRYPAGDRAMWMEPEGSANRKFKLVGRSEEGARVGPVSLFYDDLWDLLSKQHGARLGLIQMQMVVEHRDLIDSLLLKLAVQDVTSLPANSEQLLIETLMESRPLLKDLVDKAKVHPPRVEFVEAHDLKKNPRTGKLVRILDLRYV